MTQRLLIVGDSYDLNQLGQRDLGDYSDLFLLYWVSPDVLDRLRRLDGPRCHTLLEIVGALEGWEEAAAELMWEICQQGPSHRGRPWRSLLAEPLFVEARAVHAIVETVRLCRERIEAGTATEIHLQIDGNTERIFRRLIQETDRIRIVGTGPSRPRRPRLARRLWRRAMHARLAGDWKTQAINLLAQADRHHTLRLLGSRLFRKPRVAPGGVTFFSSYLNNSRTLQALEPYLEEKVTWVVTNAAARLGIDDNPSKIYDLWRFAPSTPDTLLVDEYNLAPLSDVLGENDATRQLAQRTWLTDSATWRYWREIGRVTLPRLTACWEHFLAEARPKLIVVANQWGIEGWFTQLARDSGIPVLQLLHGILGGPFYTREPMSADALIVWGEFWRDQRPAREHSRIHIFNPGITSTPETSRMPAELVRVTFFSWPFDRLTFYNSAELLDGFITLFHDLLTSAACSLTIRAHPLENHSDLTRQWEKRYGAMPEQLQLSQREPLPEILAQTDIAIMFRSTIMLDCFAQGIPVLLPDWIDFGWNLRLGEIDGVHLALSFEDLKQTLLEWLNEPPQPDRRTAHHFLQPAGERQEVLETVVREITDRPVLQRSSQVGNETYPLSETLRRDLLDRTEG